jgi:hypothetical protein
LGLAAGRAYTGGHEGQPDLRGRASYLLAGCRRLTCSPLALATGNGSPGVTWIFL